MKKESKSTPDRPWPGALPPKLLQGITLAGQRARLEKIHSIKPTRLRVFLRQGINRQIRRMFYEVGYEVKKLIRIRIGRLRLGDLPLGHWRPLTKSELKSIKPPNSR